jgi:amino acid permease
MNNKAKFGPLPSSESPHDHELGQNNVTASDAESLEVSCDAPTLDASPVLQRRLSFFDGLGIIVGIIIGSGIFSSPGLALERSGSPALCLIAWSASGMLVCLTSQCYFELGSMMPTAGTS